MANVRAFPFAELPQVTRTEIADQRALRDLARSLVDLPAVGAAFARLVGESVVLGTTPRPPVRQRPGGLAADRVGVVLGAAASSGPRQRILVDAPADLAHVLVARTLRQRVPKITQATTTSSHVAGAFAALIHAALRGAHAGTPLQVLAAGSPREIAPPSFGSDTTLVTTILSVLVGDEVFDARVSIPAVGFPEPDRTTVAGRLDAFGDAPIAIPLVLATVTLRRSEVDELATGDALLLSPDVPIAVEPETRAITGTVALVPGRAERGLGADLAGGDQLVLRTDRIESHPWEVVMGHESATASGSVTLEVLEDAPVVVRVEVGAVEMRAREWAALAPGDVIALGRRLGDTVVLRIAGVEVGRGDLVQIEGEIGVRIVSRGGTAE